MVRDKRRISWIYGWRIKGNFTGIRHYNHYICTKNTKIKFFDYAVSISFCCCCWVAQSCLTLVTPWTAAHQASLSFTDSWSLLKLMSIELVMPSNQLILCHPLLLLSVFPSFRIFSNESARRISWPKYWRFSFSISFSNEYSGLISFKIDWFDLLTVQGTLKCLI